MNVSKPLTALLRASDDPLFRRLRELLGTHAVDPMTAVLADFFPDDGDQEFGVVVTASGRVVTFVLHYGRRGDLKQQVIEAVLHDWTDITDTWQTSPYRPEVRSALALMPEA